MNVRKTIILLVVMTMMMTMIMMINHDDDNDDIRLFRTCFLGTAEQKVFTHTLVKVPDLFPNL